MCSEWEDEVKFTESTLNLLINLLLYLISEVFESVGVINFGCKGRAMQCSLWDGQCEWESRLLHI